MHTLFTIGYQQSDITSVLDVLRENGVETVIDVRALPVSRKPGFSKGSLARALDEHGIAYVHERALGTPPDARDAHKARRFDAFHALYDRHLQSDDAAAGLDRVAGRAAQGPCCLLCFERDPGICHRRHVARSLADRGFDIVDLVPPPMIASGKTRG